MDVFDNLRRRPRTVWSAPDELTFLQAADDLNGEERIAIRLAGDLHADFIGQSLGMEGVLKKVG